MPARPHRWSTAALAAAILVLSSPFTLSSAQTTAKKATVPGWGIAVIIVGSLAVIAAIVIPIACCCTCQACETEEDDWDYERDTCTVDSSRSATNPGHQHPSGSGYSRTNSIRSWNHSTVAAPQDRTPAPPPPQRRERLMSQSQEKSLALLSHPDTADPSFGPFVPGD